MACNKSVDEWVEEFKKFDKDGSGSLSIQEFASLMRDNGCNVPDSQIATTFIECDGVSGDRRISCDEFKAGMEKLQNKVEGAKKLFQEVDKDGSGFLNKEELKKLCKNCYPAISDDEVEEIFTSADKNGEGKLSLEEFLTACT